MSVDQRGIGFAGLDAASVGGVPKKHLAILRRGHHVAAVRPTRGFGYAPEKGEKRVKTLKKPSVVLKAVLRDISASSPALMKVSSKARDVSFRVKGH